MEEKQLTLTSKLILQELNKGKTFPEAIRAVMKQTNWQPPQQELLEMNKRLNKLRERVQKDYQKSNN